MKKFLMLAGAALLMSACSNTSTEPRSPRQVTPTDHASADVFCGSGYVIAYDENGNAYCAPDPNARNQARPRRP